MISRACPSELVTNPRDEVPVERAVLALQSQVATGRLVADGTSLGEHAREVAADVDHRAADLPEVSLAQAPQRGHGDANRHEEADHPPRIAREVRVEGVPAVEVVAPSPRHADAR